MTLPIRRIAASDVDRAREMLRTAEKRVQLHGLDPVAEATSILEMAEYPELEETVPIQAIRLDEQIIVTFPGEVFLEFAQQVMNSSEKDVMVFGLANDYVGYIPTKEAFSQGGYEVKTSKASSPVCAGSGRTAGGGVLQAGRAGGGIALLIIIRNAGHPINRMPRE